MDIKCPKCGEPWEMDTIHDEVTSRFPDKPWKRNGKHDQELYERKYYNPVKQEFFRDGCKALGGKCSGNKAHPAIAAIYDICGDDLDGAACDLEDYELLFGDE